MSHCLRCYVSGRVQGVWYRASTQARAGELGISGYAHNLEDGRVEVLACGDEESLEQLKQWLWQGPSGAEVTSVACHGVEVERPRQFTTG